MTDQPIALLAALQRTLVAKTAQWQHRMQVARREARDQATERGMLSSSIRFSLEGRGIAAIVEAMVPEVEQLVIDHLNGAVSVADLPATDALTQAVEMPIRELIENEVNELRGSPKRQAFQGSGIHNGAITAAVATIEPTLHLLTARLDTLLQNRKAELISSARASPRTESWGKRAYTAISVARTIWWLIASLAAIVFWAWNGFAMPF